MQYQVFVQNESEQHFVASVLGIPNLTVEGKTEEEAISNVKSALEAQLAKGKFVTIEVDAEKESNQHIDQMKYAGIFASDPTFDDFMEKLATIRKESNATVDE
jgi:predicted RNase H-like HicB family nuclease